MTEALALLINRIETSNRLAILLPCGTTGSYAQLAEQVGRPAAVRAVGSANPVGVVGLVIESSNCLLNLDHAARHAPP